MDENNNN